MRRLAAALAFAAALSGCAGKQLLREPPLGDDPEEASRFMAYENERVARVTGGGVQVGDVMFTPDDIAVYYESQDAFEASLEVADLVRGYGAERRFQKQCAYAGMCGGCLLGSAVFYARGYEYWGLLTLPTGAVLGTYGGSAAAQRGVDRAAKELKENVRELDKILRRKHKIPKKYPGGIEFE